MESSDEDVSSNSSGENESLESNDDQTRSPRRTLSPRREDSMSDIENICVPLPSLYHGRIRSSNGKEERISDDEVIGVGNSLIFPDSILAKYLPKDPIDEMDDHYEHELKWEIDNEKSRARMRKIREQDALDKAEKNVVKDVDLAESTVKGLRSTFRPKKRSKDFVDVVDVPNRTDPFINKLIQEILNSDVIKIVIELDKTVTSIYRKIISSFFRFDIFRKAYIHRAIGDGKKKKDRDLGDELSYQIDIKLVTKYLYDIFHQGDGYITLGYYVDKKVGIIPKLFEKIKDGYTNEKIKEFRIEISHLLKQRYLFRDNCFMFDIDQIKDERNPGSKMKYLMNTRRYDITYYQNVSGVKVYQENADLIRDDSKNMIGQFVNLSGGYIFTHRIKDKNNLNDMMLPIDYWKEYIKVPYISTDLDHIIRMLMKNRSLKVPYVEGYCEICSGVTSEGGKYNPLIATIGTWNIYLDPPCERWIKGSNFRLKNVNVEYDEDVDYEKLSEMQLRLKDKRNNIAYSFTPINHYLESFEVPEDRNAVFVIPYYPS